MPVGKEYTEHSKQFVFRALKLLQFIKNQMKIFLFFRLVFSQKYQVILPRHPFNKVQG
jgi:hypothetical protein